MAIYDGIGDITNASAMPPTAEEGVRMRELTLQTLNVFLPSKLTDTGRLFYSKELFESNVQSWQGKYLIYSPTGQHIDWEKYNANPSKEMQRYDARIVGLIEYPRVPETGTPRLDASGYLWDDEANEKADSGELGISTDFNCGYTGETMSGYITPNYVLCFPMDIVNRQQDLGARVMNSAVSNQPDIEVKMEDDVKGAIAELKGLITGFIGAFKGANVQNSAPELLEAHTLEVAPSVPVEYLNQIETMKAENEKTSAELASIREQYDAIKATEASRAEADKAAELQRLETVWQTTIMPKLPAALLVDEAKKAEIQKLAIEQPLEFMQQYGDQMNRSDINVANSAPAGQAHQNSNPEEKDLVIGSYNARTGAFE
jgi:hypothetical protein